MTTTTDTTGTPFTLAVPSLEFSVNVDFSEPLVGPHGYSHQAVAVDSASVQHWGRSGHWTVRHAKGRAVKKDGSIGLKEVIAYSLGWNDLPQDVRDSVLALYRAEVAKAANATEVAR